LGRLAATADVEAGSAREWIRIGRLLNDLPVVAGHFAAGRLSYAKVRTGPLLHYDHNPPFHHTRRTVIDELELRCAPCHRQRHHPAS
jgi:hypothetical protein